MIRTFLDMVRHLVARLNALVARRRIRMAELRVQNAWFETEMYGGLYRHASKCDDDLPIVPRA